MLWLWLACQKDEVFAPEAGMWTIDSFEVADDGCALSGGDADDPGTMTLTIGDAGAFTVATEDATWACVRTDLDFGCEPVGWEEDPYGYEIDLDGFFTTATQLTGTMAESISCVGADCTGFTLPCTTSWDLEATGPLTR